MIDRLTILLGDFSNADVSVVDLLREWDQAKLLHSVAWIDAAKYVEDKAVMVELSRDGTQEMVDLYELITSRIWRRVSVIGVRSARLDKYEDGYFEKEISIRDSIEKSFADSPVSEFSCCTVSIADVQGMVASAFDPRWHSHLIQEPVVRVDPSVAAQPIRTDHRDDLVLLLALVLAGGFIWQQVPLIGKLRDATRGDHKPVRLARSFLRVVNGGRLTDDVLAGAFPASGPWSVPGDVPNARAVPPGTKVPEAAVDAVEKLGKFGFQSVDPKQKQRRDSLGVLNGLKIFVREFWKALAGIPQSMVATVRGEVEGWVQRITFGEDSSLVLKFDPLSPDFDLDEITSQIQILGLTDEIDAVSSSIPWDILQRVSFGLIDGGRYPDEFVAPKNGIHRLVFTDPAAIGPSPSLGVFTLSEAEISVLGLTGGALDISVVDVLTASALDKQINHQKAPNDAETAKSTPQTTVKNSKLPPAKEVPGKVKPVKKKKWWQLKSRAKKDKSAVIIPVIPNPPKGAISDGPQDNEVNNGSETLAAPHEEVLIGENSKDVEDKKISIDRHIPGHPEFVPTNYSFVCRFYQGDSSGQTAAYEREQETYRNAISEGTIPVGNFASNNSCDHCGTKFQHGVLLRHDSSGELVRIGRVCAEKSYGVQAISEFQKSVLADLELRWKEWLALQSGSFLWRIGARMARGIDRSEMALKQSIEILASRPAAQQAESGAARRFSKWTRRGVSVFFLLLAASVASVIFTPLPLLLFALILSTYATGLLIRIFFLSRELVRVKYRLDRIEDQYERAYEEGKNALREIVRLSSMNEQFGDWQRIIREIVHTPFGKGREVSTAERTIDEINRPPSFVLAKASPDQAQKMRPYLNARSQTIHAGWISEIRDVIVAEWKIRYSQSRLLSDGDNIVPESDNASPDSVVGRHPLTDEDVYYPRADLRRQLIGGGLQEKLISEKAQQIAADLRRTPIETLLGNVEVSGPGKALSGMPVESFLNSLSQLSEQGIPFFADVISDSYPQLRGLKPELQLPESSEVSVRRGAVQVEPGVEFTAAAWVVEISEMISPLEALRGIQKKSFVGEIVSDDDSVS